MSDDSNSPTDPERLLRQQESLRQVIESISSELELRPLLTRIVRHACELIGADNGTIGLVDELHQVIRTEAIYQMPLAELGAEMPSGVGLAGQVWLAQQPLLLNRYEEVGQSLLTELSEYAVIGLPIFWRERMIGFFGIGAAPPRRFTDHDAETLTIFARHAAIAIENARLFAKSQSALDQAQLLYQTSQRISMAMDVDEVIQAYLEQVTARSRYACSVVLYELDEQGQRAAVIVRGQWTHEKGLVHLEERIPYSHDALDPPLDAGQTITVADVHTDPRVSPGLREIQIQAGRPALAFIPLMVRGQRIGLVVLSDTTPHPWEPAGLHPYQATAAQLATAIDSRRQHSLLSERGRQIAVLKERQRLARDLHDSVTQLIFSITLIAQSVAPAWRRDPAEGERRISRLLELSQSALVEMRALLAELRPPDPQSLSPDPRPPTPIPGIVQVQREGLVTALQSHNANLARDGLQVKLNADGYIRQPLEQEETLYRIAQEALNNVVKHACAQCVELTLALDPQSVQLKVIDDGVGFVSQASPTSADKTKGGLGLMTMRERAESLGGTIQLTTAPGAGVTVTVTIPRKDGNL